MGDRDSAAVAAGETEPYTAVAVVLHWAIAAAIGLNLFVGWWMHEAIGDPAQAAAAIAAFQLHKSVGLAVLVLSVLRLGWRLAHPAPALPPMPAWQRQAARLTHGLLYALMIAVPLSGWLYVSAQWDDGKPLNVPTLWFGLFEVPHLFGLNTLAEGLRGELADVFEEGHELLAWSMGGLLLLHVAAALKHWRVDRDAVFGSMRPGLGLLIALGTVAAIVAAGARTAGTPAVAAIGSAPGGWRVDPSSVIAFSGTHAGVAFRGTFARWTADIRVDPASGVPTHLSAVIDTASARDGVKLHDESLPQAEWFDTARYPQARFEAGAITPVESPPGYAVAGTLTLKDRALPVSGLHLSVTDDTLTLRGRTELSRRDADLGMESDPAGEYVSLAIGVEVNVLARRP